MLWGLEARRGYLLFYIILKHSSSLIIYASQYFLCTNCSPVSLPGTVIDVVKNPTSVRFYPQLKKKKKEFQLCSQTMCAHLLLLHVAGLFVKMPFI